MVDRLQRCQGQNNEFLGMFFKTHRSLSSSNFLVFRMTLQVPLASQRERQFSVKNRGKNLENMCL